MSQATESEEMPTTDSRALCLVGCGDAKNNGLLPAKDKYSSNYFGLKRGYAETVCDKGAVISAKFHVLEFDDPVDDYDRSLHKMDASETEVWGDTTMYELHRLLFETDDDGEIVAENFDEIHLLLGKAYREPLSELIEWVREHTGIEIVEPFEDTVGIGDQMGVLKQAIEAHEGGN